MNLLLDTHVFLWWDRRETTLNADARAAIEDPRNDVFISAASMWEIAIKRRLGKLTFHGSASSAIGANGFHELPIVPIDAEDAGNLAWHHNDPFDRLLVAQAMRLGLVLLTADRSIRSFDGVALLPAG
ncbi:type II toxin-antitoxin system VapC family toxin [Acidisphaera sp. S103]|uniref:type II toxin-antitoxin system VapC family toxin n=1 Tax=Acidisphaera sp. S103 TaxID=1747223 RepID=UPI00131C908F|nr:type II toxin-antitoxin system VapC family toxin [Acidisphaera sp. S103]